MNNNFGLQIVPDDLGLVPRIEGSLFAGHEIELALELSEPKSGNSNS
jgi:hypothetical protein